MGRIKAEGHSLHSSLLIYCPIKAVTVKSCNLCNVTIIFLNPQYFVCTELYCGFTGRSRLFALAMPQGGVRTHGLNFSVSHMLYVSSSGQDSIRSCSH